MATFKRHDTWPPLRGQARDGSGNILDLSTAASMKAIIVGPVTLIKTATAIDPNANNGFNWQALWAVNDLLNVGEYAVELEVTWDALSTPPKVQTFPGGVNPTFSVVADLG